MGVCNGYVYDNEVLVSRISASQAQVVIVGQGNPKQELWIYDNHEKIGATVFIGVGAFFDFYSGNMKRAPKWVRAIKMEWFHRMILEPRRLWRRYLYGSIIFLFRVMKQKLSSR